MKKRQGRVMMGKDKGEEAGKSNDRKRQGGRGREE